MTCQMLVNLIKSLIEYWSYKTTEGTLHNSIKSLSIKICQMYINELMIQY